MANAICLDCVSALKAARAKQIETWVHERDGRFVVAKWDGRAAQWTWHQKPPPKHVSGYCYSFARTLAGCTRHYASRSGAIASLPSLRPEEHRCSSCENDVLAACEAEDRAYRTAAQDETEALETQRRHEAEEAALLARDIREAQERFVEQAEAVARAQAAVDRETAIFWKNLEPGDPIAGARDLTVIAVDREKRQLTARTPKGAERVYTAFASDTGNVHLAAVAQ